jgi:hypothetical protein
MRNKEHDESGRIFARPRTGTAVGSYLANAPSKSVSLISPATPSTGGLSGSILFTSSLMRAGDSLRRKRRDDADEVAAFSAEPAYFVADAMAMY